MFKSASIFRIINAARITDAALQANEFTPCGPTQPHSAGWIPPRPGSAGLANMAETVAGQTILLARIETRTVPGPALKKALAETCAKLEAEQGRKVGKKQQRELKDQITTDLLPRAFPKAVNVPVWITPDGLVVIGSTSTNAVDTVITMLVCLHEQINVVPVHTLDAPTTIMTGWLLDGDSLPTNITIGRACELKANDERKSTVRYARAPLDTDEVKAYLRQGMAAQSLELTWRGRVSFTLDHAKRLRGIEFLDVVFEGRQDEGAEQFDADVAIATGELAPLIADVLAALGGEKQPG